jgi:hypothetical protein
MKPSPCLLACCLLLIPLAPAAARDRKSPLPGPAKWDVRAFNTLFRVVKTEYDKGKKRVRWTLQLKEGVRTIDFVRGVGRERPFTFLFLGADKKELSRIELKGSDFKGVPKTRVMKAGTRLEVAIDLPRDMARVKTVELRRGKIED